MVLCNIDAYHAPPPFCILRSLSLPYTRQTLTVSSHKPAHRAELTERVLSPQQSLSIRSCLFATPLTLLFLPTSSLTTRRLSLFAYHPNLTSPLVICPSFHS
ncbi:uncharacterized protein IAS62_005381 [Cryptococcus decagattii]|uniref:Uncharacterized protein n=1 Tax=Cryptococcus decagattii TaxID=1859122 RepID=A0ABZ2B2Y0_9TREE